MRVQQQPDGAQTGRRVQKLEELIAAIPDISAGISTGNVDASGYVHAVGMVTGDAGVRSVGAYNTLVSGSPYKVQYIMDDGTMGYVPSSLRYKQDIETAELDVRAIMQQLRVVTFRYIGAVQLRGDDAVVEWGLIAEEVHAIGLWWLVDYDENGNPDGLKHERWAVLLILDAQDKQRQIDSLADRVTALET